MNMSRYVKNICSYYMERETFIRIWCAFDTSPGIIKIAINLLAGIFTREAYTKFAYVTNYLHL